MAEALKGPTTTNSQSRAHLIRPEEVEIPTGWKYKRLKLGPIALPWYASPESQLILVSFVCFLCPGKAMQHVIFRQTIDYVKACSMLSTASVVQASIPTTFMLVTPQTLLSTLLSRLLVSSPAPSPTLSALEPPSHLVGLDIAFTLVHIYVTAILKTSAMLCSLAPCSDVVLVFSGLRKARL
jgi:hypothetical protein